MHRHLCNNQQYTGNIRKQKFRNWGICRNGIPCGQHADDANSRVAVDDVMWKSHKSIPQMSHTNESHKMIAQDKMTLHPRMEMANDAFGCSRATQVPMEDLRQVNLTEKCPSRRGERFKAPC